MLDHIFFLFYLLIFLISNIGYGFLLTNSFRKNLRIYNFGYLGILGFFVIVLISYLSSYFFAHGYLHNTILHLTGVMIFIFNITRNTRKYSSELRNIFIIFFIFLIGIYVFKNHDDFGYYHLTYSLNLSENKFMIGTGLFSHGFRTSSSIFYYHSILYMPYIKYYLFHSGPFFILVFFNYIIIQKLICSFKKKNFDIIYFFSILSFVYVNVVFYRLAEHGTDRSAQILVFLVFITLFELMFSKIDLKEKISKFNYLIIFIFLAASMKVLFLLYTIFIPLIFIIGRFYYFYNFKKNVCILTLSFFLILFNFSNSFFSTGCLVYPAKSTCFFNKFSWSIDEKEVDRMNLHYEWWSKAGGGPNYSHDMDQEKYVKNFNWLENWIDKHFFNKVSDTLLGTLFICFLIYILFRSKKKKKNQKTKKLLPIYIGIIILILEWFLKHPSMRYGGYVLIALPMFVFLSNHLDKYNFEKKKMLINTFIIILLSISIFNIRNFLRFDNEVNNYYDGYQISNSPFFYIPKVKSKIVFDSKNLKIYKPIDNMCWATKTPCSYKDDLKVLNKKNFKIIIEN